MSTINASCSVPQAQQSAEPLWFGPKMPLRQLQRAINEAPEVGLTCWFQGEAPTGRCCVFKVSKAAAYRLIGRIRAKGLKTVAADMVFGQLVIG